MFDIGWSELLIIAIVAIVVVGPKELPKMLRAFGATVGKMRRMANEFQDQFKEALREAEFEEERKKIEQIASNNPLTELRDEMKSLAEEARFDPNATMTPPQTDFAAPKPEEAAAPPPSALAPPPAEEPAQDVVVAPAPPPAAPREPASTGAA